VFLSTASVRRPVAMSCLIIALSLLGINAWRTMGLELMPRTDVPFITIVTVFPGASPEQIETDVAKPIEDQMVTIDGLKHISSACMENVCQTMLEFQLHVDVDIVATDVREKLDLIRADFPEDVEDPQILKFDINAQPIINLALTGRADLEALYDYADNTLRDRLTVISGVADVELIGGAEREVHVLLDRERLAARGLTSLDVVAAVQQGVRTIPSGRVRQGGTEFTVKFDAEFEQVERIGDLELVNRAGQRCYLRDVGQVRMTTAELRRRARVDGRECVAIRVVKKGEANTVAVVRAVREAMDRLNRRLPAGMELIWVSDNGHFIEATVQSAWLNVAEGIALTALILFLFLYNVRMTIIVAITMPLTILIGLFFMSAADLSLNTSTLLAIGMSVGILVTNSIVVLESIARRLEEKGQPREAAQLGTSQAAIAVLASAGTNIVVLLPITVMGSLIGLFMRPFALTMLIMTAVSLFISFTLTPILCSVLLKPGTARVGILARMERGWNRMFGALINAYGAVLRFNERHRAVALLVLVAVFALLIQSFFTARTLGLGFFTEPDQGQVIVKLEFPTRYDLNRTLERVRDIEGMLKDVPVLERMLTTIGKVEGIIGQSSEGVYLAQVLLVFPQRTERAVSTRELQQQVRRRLQAVPECTVTVSVPTIVGGQSYNIEMEIAGPDLDRLDVFALQAEQVAGELPGFTDTDTTVRIGKPELRIRPNRAILADLGLPATTLGLTLRANLEGLEAGTFKRGDRSYDIVVELAEMEGKQQVAQFLLPGAPGRPLVLEHLGEVKQTLAPVQITRKDKQRISKLLANIDSRKALGTAVQELSQAFEQAADLPTGYEYSFAGDYELMTETQAELGEAGLIAVVLVILSLAAILESFKQPWLILVTIPLALPGVFWALALTGRNMAIFVMMGIVMMIGIVVNNAILIIDQMNTRVREGVPRHKAMISAATERLRAITMITLAAVLGMLPLALGRGIGAELRNDIGIATVGGIFVSGVLTLVVVPILYDLATRRSRCGR